MTGSVVTYTNRGARKSSLALLGGMRVYHLIKSLGRGGAEMLIPEGLRDADRAQFDYKVGYFLPWKNDLVPAIEAQGCDVRCFRARTPGGMLARVPQVARELKRWRADVVHCHLPMAGVVGRLAGRIAGVPVVYSEHNLQERYHRLTFQANKRSWPLQERVVAVSGDVQRSIHGHIGTHVPVQVVRNGVSLVQFQRDAEAGRAIREAHGIAADAPLMGTVAVFRFQKRLPEWLDAARRVRERVPDARFVIVGDGPLADEVKAAVVSNGLEDAVILPGLLTDVRPWLSAMDVYVMSSIFEGLPVAMLEAMACELPVVSTSVGGIGEVLREGVDGHLIDPEHPENIADRVVSLYADRDRLRGMGEAARARIDEAFSMGRMMGELESIYRDVARA